MSDITLSDLSELLIESIGAPDEGTTIEGEQALDTSFMEFGYDSLAMLQLTALVSRKYGIVLDDDAVAEAETPRQLLAVINAAPQAGSVR
ncbi:MULTISPECIES: acyl carrier protein [unclassified Streptomyces]|uniref:acyl carrier protein n=1 Tax=unclassified Streptomyces TaxID=2593676 RepID=UPI003323A4D3